MSDASTPGGTGGATISRRALVISAGVTAVVAFALGFGLGLGGGDGGDAEELVAGSTTTAAPTTTVTTVTRPADSRPPETTAPPTTEAPPATEETVPPTSQPVVVVTEPPPTVAPARLVAQYDQDSAERLVMNKGGTALVTISNVGGSLASWLVQASGYVYLDGVSSGTLQPGQSVQVRLRGAPDVPAMAPQGHLTITGGVDGQLTIAVLVL